MFIKPNTISKTNTVHVYTGVFLASAKQLTLIEALTIPCTFIETPIIHVCLQILISNYNIPIVYGCCLWTDQLSQL